jgi:hypothetical protein
MATLQKHISLFITIYKNFVLIKKQMNVEIMQWDLSLSDVVKFKSIISLAQLHGQLNPPPALPFTCVVLFGPTDKYVQSNNCNKKLLILGTRYHPNIPGSWYHQCHADYRWSLIIMV